MPRDKIHILFASRLVEEKGVDILIKAIEYAIGDPSWKDRIYWTICSDGLYENMIRDLARRYPNSVQYVGKVSISKLADLYRIHDYLFMPSRFLETFGLTALESLACGTPVVGFRKGGLDAFIPEKLALDPVNPIESFFHMLNGDISAPLDVSLYSHSSWKMRLESIFPDAKRVFLIHDYREKIGGAEYYIEQLESAFLSLEKKVERYSYEGSTSSWKRRLLFIFSLFAFWRYFSLLSHLKSHEPDAIWMHSVMRYIGVWGLLAVRYYSRSRNIGLYISHHDVGLLAPFPQFVTEEREIPESSTLGYFTRETHGIRKALTFSKWIYVTLYRKILPKNITHIIFSSFMEKHVKNHFGEDTDIILLPHSYDESIFHP